MLSIEKVADFSASPLSRNRRQRSNLLSSAAILVVAFVLTSLLGLACSQNLKQYFQIHPYRIDPSYYCYHAALLHEASLSQPAMKIAIRELITNDRDPFRFVPVLILAPKLLSQQVAPLATALPCMFVFLSLIGFVSYRRANKLPYAVLLMVMVASMPGFINPAYGLGTFFLDLVAALFLGSAAICLIEYGRDFQRGWLFAFATLTSLTLVSRYAAAGYVAFCLVPALFCQMISLAQKRSTKAALIDFLLVTAVGFVESAWYLLPHFYSNYLYYSLCEPDGNGTILSSATALLPEFARFIGIPSLIAMVLFALAPVMYRRRYAYKKEVLLSWWFAISALILNIVVVRFVGREYNHHPILYAVPLFILGCVTCFNLLSLQKRAYLLALASMVLVSAASISVSFDQVQEDTVGVSHIEIQEKALDLSIANLLCKEPDGRFWYCFVDDVAHNIQNECQFGMNKYRAFPKPGFKFFTTLPAFWDIRHRRGATTETISAAICKATDNWLDLVVVFDDPAAARDPNKKYLPHKDSRVVAEAVARMVKESPNWRKVREFASSRYGKLAAYENLNCHGRGYKAIAQGLPVSP